MDWVRLYHDMPTDPKWRVIAKRADQRIGDVIAVYVFLLCNASSNTVKRGVTHGFVAEDVAAAIDLEVDGVTAILGAMEGKVAKNGELLGWEKRNPKREDSSTERVKKHRETHRNAEKRPELEAEKIPSSLRSDGAAAPPTPRAKKIKTAIPGNFPDEDARKAACQHWRERDRADLVAVIADEANAFRAHHISHGKRMDSWGQAWVTWYSNAIKFNRKPNGAAHGKRTAINEHLDGLAELIGDIREGSA